MPPGKSINVNTAKCRALLLACLFTLGLGSACMLNLETLKNKINTMGTATITQNGNEPWEIHLATSGGFAGVRQSLELNSSGSGTVRDDKADKRVPFQVSQAQLDELTALVNDSLNSSHSVESNTCIDCFQYDLSVAKGDRSLKLTVNDFNLEKSGLHALIHTLTVLQNDLLMVH